MDRGAWLGAYVATVLVATLVLVLAAVLVLVFATSARAATLPFAWDYNSADAGVEAFRLWRVPGPCPPAALATTPLVTTFGTARQAQDTTVPATGTFCWYVTALGIVVAPTAVWTPCANEGGTCRFTGTQIVSFGTGSQWTWKTATTSLLCSTTTMGDPAPGATKRCEVAPRAAPSVESAPSNYVQQPALGIGAPTQFRLVPQ